MRLFLYLLIAINSIVFASSPDVVRKMRDQIAELNIAFNNLNYPQPSQLTQLEEFINELNKDSWGSENEKIISNLVSVYQEFKVLYGEKQVVDTLKSTFRNFNNTFNSFFCNFLLKDILKSKKKKILIFSTSISCECTLKMCFEQEAEIQELFMKNKDLFDYVIIDSWKHQNLQAQYDVGFIPTVIILDSENIEIKRYISDSNMAAEINRIILITN